MSKKSSKLMYVKFNRLMKERGGAKTRWLASIAATRMTRDVMTLYDLNHGDDRVGVYPRTKLPTSR